MGSAKRPAGRKPSRAAAADSSDDSMQEELATLKRLMMLQLVASGVKPIDIALTLGMAKSAMSALIPVRKLSIGKRQQRETLFDVDAAEIIKRLDTLISLARRRVE
jgi:hypothetical protein